MQRDQSIAIKGDREKSIFYTRTWNRKLKGDTVTSSELEARADLARGKGTLY